MILGSAASAPALAWFAAIALGVALQSVFSFAARDWIIAGSVVAVCWCVVRFRRRSSASVLLLVLWAIGSGWWTYQHQERQQAWLAALPEGIGAWEARVIAVPPDDGVKQEWLVRPAALPGLRHRPPLVVVRPSEFVTRDVSQEQLDHVRSTMHSLAVGDSVFIQGTLTHPNPAGNPGEFDFRSYQLRQGIVGTVYAQRIERLGDRDAFRWTERQTAAVQSWMHAARMWVRRVILENASERSGPVLLAMLTGDRSAVDPEVETIFRRTGISHLMAVSGVHVGLVASLALVVSRFIGWRRWGSVALVVPWIVFYVLLAGTKPSALRAGIMAVCGLLAFTLGRRTSSLQYWALAGGLLLMYNPFSLYDVGFQLSFAASGAILLWVRAARTMEIPAGWRERLRLSLRVNVAAQASTLPIIAYHFNEISLAGWFVNLFVIPIAAPVVFGGVTGVLVHLVSKPFGSRILSVVDWLLGRMLQCLEPISHWHWAAVEVPSPGWPVMLAAGMAIIGVKLWEPRSAQRLRLAGKRLLLVALGLVVAASASPLWTMWEKRVEIVFLDVGQGDAIFIRTPRGRTVLIDGGGSPRSAERPEDFFDVGKHRVMPFLRHRGIRRIDVLINSHPHEDHLQGLLAVLRERQVAHVIDAGDAEDSITYREYRGIIAERSIAYHVAARHDVIQLEPGIYLEVLHPPADAGNEWQGLNNRSLILRLVTPYGNVLFTGDIERAGQQELLWGGEKLDLAAQVVKVPHHGSGRDLERRFIDAVRPEIAVIQVGKNSFGHPAPAVIAAYEERGARVLRTDRHGAVTVRLSKRGLHVTTFR